MSQARHTREPHQEAEEPPEFPHPKPMTEFSHSQAPQSQKILTQSSLTHTQRDDYASAAKMRSILRRCVRESASKSKGFATLGAPESRRLAAIFQRETLQRRATL
jgi:hypothetical protein